MSKFKEDFEAHKHNVEDQYTHFNNRIDDFANYLQSAMNPTVKLKNGEEQEVFLSEAVVMIHDDLKHVKRSLVEMDQRTEILKDLSQIKKNYVELKTKLKKYLKPVFKFIVFLSSLFIVIYLCVLIVAGKLTFKDALEFFIKLFT